MKIRDIKIGDTIIGNDGNGYPVLDTTEIMKKDSYSIKFEGKGRVVCSGDHQWTLYKDDNSYTFETDHMYLMFKHGELDGFTVGESNGSAISNIKPVGEKLVKCITTNSPGHLFFIKDSKGNEVLTHNCMTRLVCGKVDTVASIMALGSSVATSIDGTKKGKGMFSHNGTIEDIQYYFEEHKWIVDYFKKRGLNELGYSLENPIENLEEMLEDLEGEEDIQVTQDAMEFEFSGNKAEVIKYKEQKFEEV